MCRSIRTLREPYATGVTDADVRAAALQYVRKVSGFRAPAAHNAKAFDQAVRAVTQATRELLDQLVVRGATAPDAERVTSRWPVGFEAGGVAPKKGGLDGFSS